MITIDHALTQQALKAHMIMQVHDELVFEVADEDLKSAKQLIEDLMVNTTQLSVPLMVDTQIGSNWNKAL